MNINKRLTWNIAGAFAKHSTIYSFFKEHDLFDTYGKIVVYDGIEECVWNGGRLNNPIPYDETIRDLYYDLGWSINLTFTNFLINTKDEKGNFLLEKMHQEGNGIILVNDDLRRYVRKNYPKYKIYYSITGCGPAKFPMDDATFNFYKDKLDIFDTLVPRCDNNLDPRLSDLDKSKLELLVTDTCVLNCPHWEDHFKAYSVLNRRGKEATQKDWDNVECWVPKDEFKRKTTMERKALGDKYPFYLSTKQIKNLIDQGFYNFKIQGRESSEEDFLYDLNRYLVNYNEESN